jgi:hypothetical protein
MSIVRLVVRSTSANCETANFANLHESLKDFPSVQDYLKSGDVNASASRNRSSSCLP